MKYYKQISNDGILLAIGVGVGGIEITEEEYDILLSEIKQKVLLIKQVYFGEISIDSVPEKWKDEILLEVEERKRANELISNEEIADNELASMIDSIL